jgi:L-lactate dehydrogenase (cytochrome)
VCLYSPRTLSQVITNEIVHALSLGPVEESSLPQKAEKVEDNPAELERLQLIKQRPPLDEILSLHDFEGIAKRVMKDKAWAYYSSGSDDEITMRENRGVWGR